MQAIPPRPSLIAHSAQFLRTALLNGEWKDVLPSERTLCVRLRISRPTLRLALAQLEREGVLGPVVKKRRVVMNPSVPGASVESRLVVLLSPVPQQAMPPFVLFWLDALRELLADSGCHLEVQDSPHCFGARPAGGLKKLTQRVPAAAWVLFRSTPEMQRWFADHDVPAVVAGSCPNEVALPSVDIDYRATCRHAAGMLLRKGHRTLALLLGSAHGGDGESELGFREALSASDAVPVILQHGPAAEEVAEVLENALRRKGAPTAFLVSRSTHVLAVVTHLLRRGYQLPRDFAIVSRDDDAFLDHVLPRITRYSADPAKFARRLARLVLELVQTGRTNTKPVRLMPDLKRGETV